MFLYLLDKFLCILAFIITLSSSSKTSLDEKMLASIETIAEKDITNNPWKSSSS